MLRTCLTTLICGALALMAGTAAASWMLLDNFEDYTVGQDIVGQNSWSGYERYVASDPASGNQNQVLRIASVSGSTRSTLKPITISAGDTGTLFFRFRLGATSGNDLFVGTTTLGYTETAGLADCLRQVSAELRAHDGSWKTVATGLSADQWYNVWHVIDNDNATWRMYIEGGNYTTQTLLDSSGDSDFAFRTGDGTVDLINLAVVTLVGQNNNAYIDDIYLDATEANLLNPIPEPGTAVMLALGLLGLLAFGRWRRFGGRIWRTRGRHG